MINKHIESLESRRLLTIIINGTAGDDTLIVDRDDSNADIIHVTLNGTPSTRTVGFEVLVQVNGLDGNDTINVVGLDRDLDCLVLGGIGNDTLRIGGGVPLEPPSNVPENTSFDFGQTTLNGEAGIDALIFDDQNLDTPSLFQHNYRFEAGELRSILSVEPPFPGSRTIPHLYNTFETVTVHGGLGDNDFNVVSPGTETTLTMNGGPGIDRLTLNPVGAATINFNGQASIGDSITVNDSQQILRSHTLTAGTYDKTGFALLNFQTVESFTLNTPNAGADVAILGVGINVLTTVNGGTGAEFIDIGGGDYDTNIDANVEINGGDGAGNDVINIDDSTDTGNDSYSLVDGVFQKGSSAITLSYSAVEEIGLSGNGLNNAFTITSAGSAQFVNVSGNAGNDAFVITPSPTATISVSGGAPTVAPGDVLSFAGAGPAGSAILTTGATGAGTYDFASAVDVTFSGIEAFPTPPAPPSVPDLLAADDTGFSPTDNITNRTTATFTGTGAAGQFVDLRVGGTTSASGTITAGGTWSVPVTFPGDGVFSVTAVTRTQGSDLTGQPSAALSVTIDTIAPGAPTVAPNLGNTSDTGVSDSDDITSDTTPTFSGAVPAGLVVRLLDGTAETGVDSTTISGVYLITSTALSDGEHAMTTRFEDLAGNQSSSSPTLPVTIDTLAPVLNASVFDFLTSQALRFIFNENVGPTFSLTHLTLENLTTPATVPPASMSASYVPHTATVSFPGFANGTLPDGDYRATLSATGITDFAGNPLGETAPFNFFFLNGDANRDRRVNLADFNIVAANFGQSPRNLSQGDFNYDTIVNLADFNILASRFGTALGPETFGRSAIRSVNRSEAVRELLDELT